MDLLHMSNQSQPVSPKFNMQTVVIALNFELRFEISEMCLSFTPMETAAYFLECP